MLTIKTKFLFFLLFSPLLVLAQQTVEGICFDVETKQRIGKVLIVNHTTGENLFNDFRGEFALRVNPGDQLIASRENYRPDTISYSGEKVLLFYLKRTSIYIDPVTVMGKKSPEEILAQRRKDYDRAYKLADPGDYFSVGSTGAGLSINAVYNLLSKEGRNARRLTKFFQKEYEENVIDQRFTKEIVTNITGLEGVLLDNFMLRFRPSYFFVKAAGHYQMTEYIKSRYEMFKLNPNYRPLPKLPTRLIDEN